MRMWTKMGALVPGIALLFIGACGNTFAAVTVRWTGFEDSNPSASYILSKLNEKTGFNLTQEDFKLVESRDLARTSFQMFAQMVSGIPINSARLRIWRDLETGRAIQVEARLEEPKAFSIFTGNHRLARLLESGDLNQVLSTEQTRAIVQKQIAEREDPSIRDLNWEQEWDRGDIVRVVKARARLGTHIVRISLSTRRVLSYVYQEFPRADLSAGTLSVPVMVWPIYDQARGDGPILPRVRAELKYLKPYVARASEDPYAPMRNQRYLASKIDPALGLTEEGRAQGLWSPSYVRQQADTLRTLIPLAPNDFERGLVLEGTYATVSLDPTAIQLRDVGFDLTLSSHFKPVWSPVEGTSDWEMRISSALLGRPLKSSEEAMSRPARRLPDHNPATYLADGFDEIQVYYGINQLFDSLRPMGFTDPELSTRPFHAFLYNTDIDARDNAFYTDDTINFTTYSPSAPNFARDNTTIWHELGHGVMDRLMGDGIVLADTGGLSEGMADFVAALVVADVTNNEPFDGSDQARIVNGTGFNLTNEVHDDGEAYGGAMYDLLQSAMTKWGRRGLTMVTDLTLEAMRLSRNHPGLTAQDWFEHMLFADQLGAAGVRTPGELKSLIEGALAGRNFSFDGGGLAAFSVRNADTEVTSSAPGSRGSPIRLSLKEADQQTFPIQISLKNGDRYQFKFPAEVRVFFESGPLQGAIDWEGEEREPLIVTVKSPEDVVTVPLTVHGKCDAANRDDGSCVDYAYFQVWNHGEPKRPVAKKRFYLRVKTASAE